MDSVQFSPTNDKPKRGSVWLRDFLMDWDLVQLLGSLLIILIMLILPLFVNSPYYLNMIVLTALFAFIGLAWNIVGGFAGQMFIGFATFVGIGAYTTISLLNHFQVSPWIGIFLSAIPSAMLGLIVSFLTLRYGLKMDYLALFTLALMIIMGLIISRIEYLGGAKGMWISFQQDSFPNMTFVNKTPYVYISAGLLLLGVIIHFLVYRSRMGRYLVAIREDEDGAAAIGVDVAKYKTFALLIATAMGGVAGGFYAIYTAYINPSLVFGLPLNVEFLTPAIFGGKGTIIGPILGALLNKPISEYLRSVLSSQLMGSTLVGYGLFLMVFMLFLPSGIAGLLRKPYEKFRSYLLKNWI